MQHVAHIPESPPKTKGEEAFQRVKAAPSCDLSWVSIACGVLWLLGMVVGFMWFPSDSITVNGGK